MSAVAGIWGFLFFIFSLNVSAQTCELLFADSDPLSQYTFDQDGFELLNEHPRFQSIPGLIDRMRPFKNLNELHTIEMGLSNVNRTVKHAGFWVNTPSIRGELLALQNWLTGYSNPHRMRFEAEAHRPIKVSAEIRHWPDARSGYQGVPRRIHPDGGWGAILLTIEGGKTRVYVANKKFRNDLHIAQVDESYFERPIAVPVNSPILTSGTDRLDIYATWHAVPLPKPGRRTTVVIRFY